IGGSLNTQPVVSTASGGTTTTRDTRTQTPFELASGLASAGYSDAPQLNVNLPIANPAGQLALTLINLGSGNLINLELSALEADNRGKVVSSPRVITADNQKAHIEQGTDIPYIIQSTTGGNTTATVQFKKAVLALDVTPQITPDNRVVMNVEVRKDSVGQIVRLQGSEYPSIDTKNVTTQAARRRSFGFVDAGHGLGPRLGVTIPTIFEIEGEQGFRGREAAVIAELTALNGIVLATGGGAVVRQSSRVRLKDNGTVVYLHA